MGFHSLSLNPFENRVTFELTPKGKDYVYDMSKSLREQGYV